MTTTIVLLFAVILTVSIIAIIRPVEPVKMDEDKFKRNVAALILTDPMNPRIKVTATKEGRTLKYSIIHNTARTRKERIEEVYKRQEQEKLKWEGKGKFTGELPPFRQFSCQIPASVAKPFFLDIIEQERILEHDLFQARFCCDDEKVKTDRELFEIRMVEKWLSLQPIDGLFYDIHHYVKMRLYLQKPVDLPHPSESFLSSINFKFNT
jgi:hypothetical protein